MKLVIALITTAALSLSLPLAAAYRPLADDGPGNRPNLTEILTPDRPFQTFLGYLQQTNLVEVFENQAYRTHHGAAATANGGGVDGSRRSSVGTTAAAAASPETTEMRARRKREFSCSVLGSWKNPRSSLGTMT